MERNNYCKNVSKKKHWMNCEEALGSKGDMGKEGFGVKHCHVSFMIKSWVW